MGLLRQHQLADDFTHGSTLIEYGVQTTHQWHVDIALIGGFLEGTQGIDTLGNLPQFIENIIQRLPLAEGIADPGRGMGTERLASAGLEKL